jgi:hypothetical protein
MVRFLWLDPEAKIAWQAQAGGVWCMYAGRSHHAHGRRCGAASGDVSVAYTRHGGSKSETPGWGGAGHGGGQRTSPEKMVDGEAV